MNGDGQADLVASTTVVNDDSRVDGVRLLLRTGALTFAPSSDFTLPTGSAIEAVADVNGDGKPDLIINGGASVSILVNNGNATFQSPQNSTGVPGSGFGTIGDLNRDGKVDLVLINASEATVSVLLGNGNGTFQASLTLPTGNTPWNVVVADVNGDGNPDLNVSNRFSRTISVYRGNGNGTFQPEAAVAISSTSSLGSVAVADLNGDGYQDLVVVQIGCSACPDTWLVSVRMGNEDGTFLAQRDFPTGDTPLDLSVADMNGDGKLDVITAVSGGYRIHLGNGNGRFQAPQTVDGGGSFSFLKIVDLNGDGKLDLVTTTKSFSHRESAVVHLVLAKPSGSLQFGSNSFTVSEDDENATLTLTRTGSTDGQVSAIVGLTGGTATEGRDFRFPAPQTVTWADGDGTNKSVSIPIRGDILVEGNETARFALTLPANPFGSVLGSQSTTVLTIADATACTPRPRVTPSVAAGGGKLQVHVESTPLASLLPNPIQQIRFGTFQNASVTLDGQAVVSGQTITMPANAVSVDFTVARTVAGQATTVPFTVVDGCGEWKTFVGGGTSAGF